MKRLISIFNALLCAMPAFCQHLTPQDHFNISITAESIAENTKLYLIYQTDGTKYLDSALLSSGQYRFTGKISKPIRATLVLDADGIGYKSLLKKRHVKNDVLQFYIHPGNIKASMNGLLAEAVFSESDLNKDFSVLQSNLKPIFERQVEVSSKLIVELDTAKLKRLRQTDDSLTALRMPVLKQFIVTHPNSFISLVALQEYYSRLKQNDNYKLTPQHFKESKTMFSNLATSVQDLSVGRELALQFANSSVLAEGALAPDFSQPDKNGNTIALSSFRGKYVLLSFWASWCGPCRRESPQLVEIYRAHSNKNFTILGISLDDKEGRTAWLKAIKDDGLQWTQVSDLKHWDNAVVEQYSITAIPQNILIGPDGRIVAKDISVVEMSKLINKLLL